ncbi:hypothetical protein TNCV_244931 [Trichonephila clavipes]|uniref:Uncharacterized protein n=1 Tax=Trichonephila clavipes TaxID=2585209 RepID=A0A8X6UXN0_TRICX|nr:hypothetical protein TNCV_244931 [Trichonephila clavipes]
MKATHKKRFEKSSGMHKARTEYFVGEGGGKKQRFFSSVRSGLLHHSLRGTLNSRRAASPLVRLLEWEDKWETPDHIQDVLPQNWGGTEKNRTVTYMVLKAKANDRH